MRRIQISLASTFLVCCRMFMDLNVHMDSDMGWLRSVGSIKLSVSFAKEPYKRDAILQERPVILSILLTVATPYGCGRHPQIDLYEDAGVLVWAWVWVRVWVWSWVWVLGWVWMWVWVGSSAKETYNLGLFCRRALGVDEKRLSR